MLYDIIFITNIFITNLLIHNIEIYEIFANKIKCSQILVTKLQIHNFIDTIFYMHFDKVCDVFKVYLTTLYNFLHMSSIHY